MANRSYLVATNNDAIYPSITESRYDYRVQVIAEGNYCVPLLWFGLFRPSDMRTQDFQVDGYAWTSVEPIVEVQAALAHLRQSVRVFDQLFPGANFTEYCNFLADAVRSTGRKYVTIEMQEIADLSEPEVFYDDCRIVMGMLAGDESIADAREKLVMFEDIDEITDVPSARCAINNPNASEDDLANLSRIMGTSLVRPVPWESFS